MLKTNGRLIALRAPSTLDPKADLPLRLLMLKWGDNATTKGNFRVGAKSLASLATNQRALGFEEVALDFEHNTVPGHPSNKGEPAAIAARAKPLVIENEGLVFDSLNWTEAGKTNREFYRDLSPTVQTDDSGEVIFCHSGALTRNGATFDLHAFSAGIDFKTLNVVRFGDEPANKNSVDLDRLRKLLQLSANATVEDINKALIAIEAMPDKGSDALGAETVKQLKTLTARFDALERKEILDGALSAGKIVPSLWLPNDKGDGGLPTDQLRSLVATLPEVVPLDQRTPEKLKGFITLTPANPIEKQVCQQLGITEDSMRKYGGTAVVTTS